MSEIGNDVTEAVNTKLIQIKGIDVNAEITSDPIDPDTDNQDKLNNPGPEDQKQPTLELSTAIIRRLKMKPIP